MSQNTLGKKFLEFIKKNDLKSYSGTDEKHYYLPYRSERKNIKVYILANVIEEVDTLKVGFRARLNSQNKNIEDIRETLLDLNARLTTGALALEKNSDVVEYTINYTVEQSEAIELERYNRIISFCINLYYDLYEKNLIERDNSMDV